MKRVAVTLSLLIICAAAHAQKLTIIKAGPCVVVQKKTASSEGYNAVQVGLVEFVHPDEVLQEKAIELARIIASHPGPVTAATKRCVNQGLLLGWQAGLALDRFKSRQEVSGQIVVGTTTEGLAATPESTKINVGGFGGIHWTVGENFTLEANLVSIGYSQVNWVPASYSGTTAAAETKTRRGLVLEVAFGFKF